MKLKVKPKVKQKEQQQTPKKASLQETAMKRLNSAGVSFSDDSSVDEHYLNLPRNITLVSDRDLGEFLYAFTQQKNYLRTLVSIANVEVMEVQKDYDEMYSKIYNNAPVENVNDKKEFAKSNKLVRQYREKLDTAGATLLLAQAQLDSLNDTIFALSREITRRDRSNDQDNREHNANNKRRNR